MIRDRSEAEARGAGVERQCRKVLDLMPDGVALVDPEGRFGYASLRAASQFGYRRDELVGRAVVDLVAPEDREMALPAILRWEHYSRGPLRLRILRADGGLAMAELHSQVFVDEQEQRNGIAMIRDVTRQARREEQGRVRHVEEAIGTFAGGLACELGEILDTLAQAAQLPDPRARAPQDEQDASAAGTPASPLRRGRELVERLRTISEQAPPNDHRALELNQVLREAEQELGPSLEPRVLLHSSLAPDLEPILGSAERLKRVVLKLAHNAQEAMPMGGHLLLRTANITVDEEILYPVLDARPGRFVMLTVQDDGVGMETEVLERIFEPYFTTHVQARSSGLGLALVQAIVRDHRGFLSVESQPGRGTRFRVYLPVHHPGLRESTSTLPCVMVLRSHNQTVLLIDDGQGIRPSIQPLLDQEGYRVLVTAQGPDACDLLERHKEQIDMVVLDLAQTGAACLQMVGELEGIKPGLKLILTGPDKDLATLRAQLGADRVSYLPSGFTRPAFQEAVRKLLEKQ